MSHGRPGRPRKDGLPSGSQPEERKEEVRRRRRKADHDGRNLKLRTPELPGFELRWAIDEGTRIHDLTVRDDYDYVTKQEITVLGRVDVGDPILSNSIDPGDRVSIPADLGGGVKGKYYLLKKREDWCEADREEKRIRREKRRTSLSTHSGIENVQGTITIDR